MFDIFKKRLKRFQAAHIAISVAGIIVKHNVDDKSYVLAADKLIKIKLDNKSRIDFKDYKISNEEGVAIAKAALFLARNETEKVIEEYKYQEYDAKARAEGSKPNRGIDNNLTRLMEKIDSKLLIFKN
jgi:hypothetical protein